MSSGSFDVAQLRLLPSIDELLRTPQVQDLVQSFSRALVVEALRECLAEARVASRSGSLCPPSDALLIQARSFLLGRQRSRLRSLVNATGVVIHTNLGRAPLSSAALRAVEAVAGGYSNLEYDLDKGERGSRNGLLTPLLCELTGAEAAVVTNNNASAVLLALSALAEGREVVISRGQLVEIGGGFRVPDVMRESGCRLVEVGTTNRTRQADYEAALSDQTALLLSVHPSNFRIMGFTESTSIEELARVAGERNVLVMDDLGSGCLLPSEQYGLAHEPMPQESLAAGADLVCFSGDKLLGGPQAGIIVGKRDVLARLAKHPLMRAVRVDKMTLAALEATLRHYQRGEATREIPVWRMITASQDQLARRASYWATQLRTYGVTTQVQRELSTIGGGSLPGETLPTMVLSLERDHLPCSLDELAARLRRRTIPVIGRIARNTFLLDPRTVLEEQDEEVLQALLETVVPG